MTATNVGTLDWAGGNVWYDTAQYRNDYPPTNAPNSGLTLSTISLGANQRILQLNNIGYSQGDLIATHIAIFIRYAGGSISITTDAIITLMNLSSLPSSYIIPFVLIGTSDYTLGVAACALTKSGYSFNGTVREIGTSAFSTLYIKPTSAIDIELEAGTAKDIIVRDNLLLDSGIVIKVNGTQVLTGQQATISDPSGGGTQDAEARAAINTIIDRLQAHGLIA